MSSLLTKQNSIHEEIKCRLKAGNSCYYSVQTFLSSRLLYKNLKIKIHKTILSHTIQINKFKNKLLSKPLKYNIHCSMIRPIITHVYDTQLDIMSRLDSPGYFGWLQDHFVSVYIVKATHEREATVHHTEPWHSVVEHSKIFVFIEAECGAHWDLDEGDVENKEHENLPEAPVKLRTGYTNGLYQY